MRSATANPHSKTSMRATQRGMALIAASFLIVVLAALGIFAVRIGGAQQQTVNLGLLGDRAVAAANSGIEFGAYYTFAAGKCTVPNSGNFVLTEMGLAGFSGKVTCAGPNGGPYTFTSFASSGAYGSPDYVSRSVTRTVP